MMNSRTLYAILIVCILTITTSAQFNSQKCSNLRIRKDVSRLNGGEWNMLKNVLTQMNRDGHFARIAKSHDTLFRTVHGGPAFFPYHRKLLQDFEDIGRRYDPNFFIPYWNEVNDFRAPEQNSLFSPSNLGGNGLPLNDYCVKQGLQQSWVMTYPNFHCLRRKFIANDDILPQWYSPEFMTSILQTSLGYDEFRYNIEFSIHGVVHNSIGGDMDLTVSPNDFIFFLHHANIDRLWWKWQNVNPSNLMKYDGVNNGGRGGRASLFDTIPDYSEKVGDVMKLGYGNMCYTYDDSNPFFRLLAENPALNVTRELGTSLAAFSRDGVFKNFKSTITYRRYRLLSDNTLEKFFPAVKNENFNTNLFEMNKPMLQLRAGQDLESDGGNSGSQLPMPIMPPDSWIQMHGFDREQVHKVVNRLTDMAKTLNNEGYVTPN